VTHTDSIVVVVDYMIDKFKSNAGALGLKEVFYGDQELIPATPAITVEGQRKTRELETTSHRTMNNIGVTMMLYHSGMQDTQVTQRDVEVLAEQVEALLHQDVVLGGLVIHGHVVEIEPGYADRSRVLLRAARIVWRGRTLTRLGG
jgi:hypothetical protein